MTHQVIADDRHAAEHSKEVFREAGEAWPDDRLKEIAPMIKLIRKPETTPTPAADAVESPTKLRASSVPQQRREEHFFTVKQLAARWQISERQVHRFIESGALAAHRIGRSLRIAESDVLLFEFQCR